MVIREYVYDKRASGSIFYHLHGLCNDGNHPGFYYIKSLETEHHKAMSIFNLGDVSCTATDDPLEVPLHLSGSEDHMVETVSLLEKTLGTKLEEVSPRKSNRF